MLNEGYCTDDNSRALLLTVLLEQLGHDTPEIMRAQSTYAAFLDYAFDATTGRFRNFLGFDRSLRNNRIRRLPGSVDLGVGHVHWQIRAQELATLGGAAV